VAVGKAWLSRGTSRCTTWSTEDHGTPHSAHSRSAVLPHAEQMTLQRWQKNVCTVARSHHFHTHHLSRATLSHTYTYIHTYVRTYIHTYVRTYVHTYVHAYYLFTYFHTQSFTASFVFPSFPVPATTFEAQYWKKLTCGVIRSFNFCNIFFVCLILDYFICWFPHEYISEHHLDQTWMSHTKFDLWRRHVIEAYKQRQFRYLKASSTNDGHVNDIWRLEGVERKKRSWVAGVCQQCWPLLGNCGVGCGQGLWEIFYLIKTQRKTKALCINMLHLGVYSIQAMFFKCSAILTSSSPMSAFTLFMWYLLVI